MIELLYCGFCHKSQNDVEHMIQGLSACICEECVALSSDSVNEDVEALREFARITRDECKKRMEIGVYKDCSFFKLTYDRAVKVMKDD